jgi:tetratricopeptide (TPR) repeat protein
MMWDEESWRCEQCGRLALPATDAPSATWLSTLARLPSVLAIPLREYALEHHPVQRLWRLCDSVEILTRFCTIVALGELRRLHGPNPLPDELLLDFRPLIEWPTFGKWRVMLQAAVGCLPPERPLVVPQLAQFVQEHLLPKLMPGADDGKQLAEEFVVPLRNQLAHGAMSRAWAAYLLTGKPWDDEPPTEPFAGWETWIDRLVPELRFFEDCKLFHFDGRSAASLTGLEGSERGPSLSADVLSTLAERQLAGHVLLVEQRGEAASVPGVLMDRWLDLWPLCDYGKARMASLRAPIESRDPSLLVYIRAHQDRLLYAALQGDLPQGERSDKDLLRQFQSLFRLEQPAQTRNERGDFEDELRSDAEAVVGRAAEIERAKRVLKGTTSGVLWLGGPGGIGKSFLMARLARDLTGDPKRGCRIAWRFKSGDAARCNRFAFFRHAVERLATWLGRRDVVPAREPKEWEDQLRTLLDDVAARTSGDARTRPRVLFLLDGLDEIEWNDPAFARIPFELTRANVVWLCAGRPARSLTEVFAADRCTHIFPGDLPGMSDDDIRAMLVDGTGSLKYPLLELDEEQRDPTGRVIVANAAVQAIVQRAAGLPLYVHFVIEDVLAKHLRWQEVPQSLPQNLREYYDDLLGRLSIGEIGAMRTPLLMSIACAQAPPDEETLFMLMVRRTVIEPTQSGRESLRRGIDSLRSLIRPVAIPGGYGYKLYHPSLRQHIAGTMAGPTRLARESFCQLIRDWASLPAGSTRLYALAQGVDHLKDSEDIEGIAGLIRDGYLSAVADHPALRIEGALERCRAAAEVLKHAGPMRWTDYVRCARLYADLAETVRAKPEAFPVLIDRAENIKRAADILQDDPDPLRQGMFMVAVSPLLSERGHERQAAELWQRGVEQVSSATIDLEGAQRHYGTNTTNLVQALLSKGTPHPSDASTGPPGPLAAAERASVPLRNTVPWLFRLIGFLSSSRLTLYFILGLVGYLSHFWVMVWLSFNKEQQDWLQNSLFFRLVFWPLAGLFGFSVLLTFLSYIYQPLFLAALRRRAGSLLDGFNAAITEARDVQEKRALFLRMFRFLAKSELEIENQPWSCLVEQFVTRHAHLFLDGAQQAAGLIMYATALGHTVCSGLLGQVQRLDRATRDAIYEELGHFELLSAPRGWFLRAVGAAAGRLLMVNNWQLLRALASTAGPTSRPEPLLTFLDLSAVTSDEDHRRHVIPTLRTFPAAYLGRAILASYSRGYQKSVWDLAARLTRGLRILVLAFVSFEGTFLIQIYRAEFVIILALLIPALIAWLPILILLPTVIVFAISLCGIMMAIGLLAGRMRYSSLLADEPVSGGAREWRRRLAASVEPLRSKLVGHEFRRIDEMILGQQLLRGETALRHHAGASVERVLAGLARSGKLQDREEVVFQVMADRDLLEAALKAPARTAQQAAHDGGEREAQRLPPVKPTDDEADDLKQLRGVLPLRPALLSWLLTTSLGLLGTALWLGAFAALLPADYRLWLFFYEAREAIGICLLLALLQHIPPLLIWRAKSGKVYSEMVPYGLCRAYLTAGAIGWAHFRLVDWAHNAGLMVPGSDRGSEWLHVVIPAIPILIVNLFVPELVAHWRGAGLFYPAPDQLWQQRVVWTGMFVAACCLLVVPAYLLLLPENAEAYYKRGIVLQEQGRLDEAEAAFRAHIRLKPDRAIAHCKLGLVLQAQGRLDESLASLRLGHQLGKNIRGWSHPSGQWVVIAEQLIELDRTLPAVLAGAVEPATADEAAGLAWLCQRSHRQLYAGSARLYTLAFAMQSNGSIESRNRYNAACAAALAGCGLGNDASMLSDEERTQWRQQALDWLRAERKHWFEQTDRDHLTETTRLLAHSLRDPDLSGVRDARSVAQLPTDERDAWLQFWREVNALIGQHEFPSR